MARAKQLTPIRFNNKGVFRGFDIPDNVPYDLENARIKRNGQVVNLSNPTTHDDDFGDGKPYFEWNGDLLDADNAIAGPIDGHTAFEVYSGDRYGRRLYLSGAATTGTVKATNYFTYALFGNYDKDTDPDAEITISPPMIIQNESIFEWGEDKVETSGDVQAGEATAGAGESLIVMYLFIPYNNRDEAGPWAFGHTVRTLMELDDIVVQEYFYPPADMIIECNSEVERVEVYSTLPINFYGVHTIDSLVTQYGWTVDDELQMISDSSILTWYKRTDIKPIEQTLGGTRYFAYWTDNDWLLNPILFSQVYDQLATTTIPTDLDNFIHGGVETNFDLKPVFRVPNITLQQERNLLRNSPARSMRAYSHDGSDFTFDGTNDRLVKDGAGAGQHQIIVTGDLTSSISVNDYVIIREHSTNGWTGVYEVSAISYSTGTGMTTIRSDNYTSTPSATSNPADTGGALYYFDGGSELYMYEGVAARTMFNHQGRMLYGNPQVPIGDPRQNVCMTRALGTGSTEKYGLVFEYRCLNNTVKRGPFYGPVTDPFGETNMVIMLLAWNGEEALQIWKYGGSGDDTDIANYELYERLTVGNRPFYLTSFLNIDEGTNVNFSFHSLASYLRGEGDAISYDAVGYEHLNYPNRVYLSEDNRPLEVSLLYFETPDETTIRAIVPARLAEEEGFQGYDFYVLTDRTVQVYQRDGDQVALIETLHNSIGVKQKTYTLQNNIQAPLVTALPEGICFVGTDERVYFVAGRQHSHFDHHVNDLLGSSIIDLAYHAEEDELWVVTAANEIWIYDLEFGGWNKNYTLASGWIIYHLFYSRDNKEMLAYIDPNTGTEDTYAFDEGGSALSASIVTQEVDDDGRNFKIDRIRIDYENTSYDGTLANMAKLLHFVDSRSDDTTQDILNTDEDNSGKRHEYNIPRHDSVYPTLLGRRHRLKVSEFNTLESIQISVSEQEEMD